MSTVRAEEVLNRLRAIRAWWASRCSDEIGKWDRRNIQGRSDRDRHKQTDEVMNRQLDGNANSPLRAPSSSTQESEKIFCARKTDVASSACEVDVVRLNVRQQNHAEKQIHKAMQKLWYKRSSPVYLLSRMANREKEREQSWRLQTKANPKISWPRLLRLPTLKWKRTVLLQTAKAVATNEDGTRSTNVRIIFDNGSQRSYVTNSLELRLNLKPCKTETLHLNTFRKQNCDVVKIRLNKPGCEEVEVSALTSSCNQDRS